MPPPVLINLGCGKTWHEAWLNYDLSPEDPAVRAIDLSASLPFTDASTDAIYHSHVLEHLEPAAARRLLTECHRVLRPRGIVRVVVPDLAVHARCYLAALESGDPLEHEWSVIQLIDQMVRTRSEGTMGEFFRQRPWRDHPRIASWISPDIGVAPARRRLTGGLTRLRFALSRLWLTRRERATLQEARFRATGENHRWMYDRLSLARLLNEVGFTKPTVRDATGSDIGGFATYGLDVSPTGVIRHPDSLYMEALKE